MLEEFYREHLPAVRSFVARRVSEPQLAADLTAEVFLAAIRHAKSCRADRGRPIAWLYVIARSVVADESRRQKLERNATSRVSGRRPVEADALARIEERLDAERDTRRLYESLAALPDRDRALMELVAVDGPSVAEAAAVLGLRPGTARVRMHRSGK